MKIELTTNPLQLDLCDSLSFKHRVNSGLFVFEFEFEVLFLEGRKGCVVTAITPQSVQVTETHGLLPLFAHQYEESERRGVALWFHEQLRRDPELKPAIARAVETRRVELTTTTLDCFCNRR